MQFIQHGISIQVVLIRRPGWYQYHSTYDSILILRGSIQDHVTYWYYEDWYTSVSIQPRDWYTLARCINTTPHRGLIQLSINPPDQYTHWSNSRSISTQGIDTPTEPRSSTEQYHIPPAYLIDPSQISLRCTSTTANRLSTGQHKGRLIPPSDKVWQQLRYQSQETGDRRTLSNTPTQWRWRSPRYTADTEGSDQYAVDVRLGGRHVQWTCKWEVRHVT